MTKTYTIYGENARIISQDAKFVTYVVENADGSFPTTPDYHNKLSTKVWVQQAVAATEKSAKAEPAKPEATEAKAQKAAEAKAAKKAATIKAAQEKAETPTEFDKAMAQPVEKSDSNAKTSDSERKPVEVDFTNVEMPAKKVVRGKIRELDTTVPEVKGKTVRVEVRAFSNMRIGEYDAVYDAKKGIYVVEMKGSGLAKALIFDKKTMRQTNANNPRFANKLILAEAK